MFTTIDWKFRILLSLVPHTVYPFYLQPFPRLSHVPPPVSLIIFYIFLPTVAETRRLEVNKTTCFDIPEVRTDNNRQLSLEFALQKKILNSHPTHQFAGPCPIQAIQYSCIVFKDCIKRDDFEISCSSDHTQICLTDQNSNLNETIACFYHPSLIQKSESIFLAYKIITCKYIIVNRYCMTLLY